MGAIVQDLGGSTRTYTGNITLAGNTTVRSSGGTLNLDGSIIGAGNLTFNTTSLLNSVVLGGATANTYTGTTNVTNAQVGLNKAPGVVAVPGNLNISSSTILTQLLDNGGENIADTSVVTLSESGGFDAAWQVGAPETVGSITGNGDISIPGISLTTGGDNSSTTYSGKFYSGTLIKTGTGTFTLTGTNPGPTSAYVVNGGKLIVNTDFSTASFMVNSGGTVGGSGMAGATTINSGGTINAGNSPGCMTVASLTLTAGANFDEELAGATACSEYDQTIVTGAANLNNATLNIVPSFTPTVGTVFTIIQAGSVTGTFNGLADGATVTVSGIQFRINYTGTTVTLTVLGGTLAPTGQNSNQTALLAFGILGLAVAGLGIEYATRRRRRNV